MKKPKQHGVKDSQTRGFLTPLLSRGQYKKEVKQRTRYEFDPLDRAIQGDLAGSQARQAEIPGWFQQYRDAVNNAATRTAGAYQQANQNFTQQAQAAGAQDTASRQDMQNRASQDASLRGVPVDYNGAQAALEAANARNNLQANFAGTIATLGANQQGYLADKGRIGAGEQINQLFKEQARERGIRNDMRALAQKRGDYASTLAGDLRESDRKYALGQQTLKGEMSRAQLSAQTSRQNNQRTTSTTARGQDITAAQRAKDRRERRRHNQSSESQQAQNEQGRNKRAKQQAKSKKKGKGGN